MKGQRILCYAIIMISACSLIIGACRRTDSRRPVTEVYDRLDRPEVFLVPPSSRAQNAGLMRGDVIIEYNGSPVSTYRELLTAESASAGEPVQVVVLRNDHEATVLAEPGPLEFVPYHFRYSGSLALALEALLTSFGKPLPYSWLAALTGESFSISGRSGDWGSWWPGEGNPDKLDEIGELVGIEVSRLPVNSGLDSQSQAEEAVDPVISAVQRELRLGQSLLARARWGNGQRAHWGIISGKGDSGSTIQAYSIGSAAPQPLTGEILEVYLVRPRAASEPEPDMVLATALDHALEMGLALADGEGSWRSGLDAYDALIAALDTAPPAESLKIREEQFRRLIWALIGSKQTAGTFLEEMSEALADETELLDEAISAHRTMVGKLEGLFQAGIRLASSEDRRRIQLVLNEIQLMENDLLGFYEEIIGEL